MDIPNLERWHNGDELGTQFGDLMFNWPDQSGNGRELTSTGNVGDWPTVKTDGPNGQTYIRMRGNTQMFDLGDSSLNNAPGYTMLSVYRTNPDIGPINGMIQSSTFVTPGTVNASHFKFGGFLNTQFSIHRRISTDASDLLGAASDSPLGVFGWETVNIDSVNRNIRIYTGGILSASELGTYGTAGNMEAVDAFRYDLGRQDNALNILEPDILEVMVFSRELTSLEITSLKSYIDNRYGF